MKVDLYIEDTKLSLFKDENIELNLSVVDVENIESNTTEFSKTFTVPASNSNNRLFKHYYNADIDNGFDARVKVNGSIFLNGFLFKLGKYRLSKVNVKNNKPSSYTIQFWGNLLTLKETLGNAELSDLDLSAYNHSYDGATVYTGLTSSLFGSDLVYSMFAKKQYYYNSSLTDHTITDNLVNIAYTDGLQSNGIKFNDLRPSLRIIKIIEAIEVYTGLTFSRDFFDRPEFTNLFLWLNPDADKNAGGNTQMIDWDSGDTNQIDLSTNIGSFNVDDSLNWSLYLYITPSAGYENIDYTIKFYKDNEFASEITSKGTQILPPYSLKNPGASGTSHTYNVYFEIETDQEFKYTSRVKQYAKIFSTVIGTYNTYASENEITSNFIVSNELPNIKIIDFLKGLFKMFKLVIIPIDDTNLYVNDLVNYYAEGNLYDITNYIDNESYDVSRGKILNEINFTFEEPTTILNIQFDKNNNRFYGDEENQIKDENGKLLDGEKFDFKVPFEQVVYERLTDQETNDLVNVQYGAIIDESLEKASPKAHIHYKINTDLDGDRLGFINDVGAKLLLSNSINIPSHTMTLDNVEYSTIFHEEFSEWSGDRIDKTLYYNYHKPYIDSIFNSKRRDYSFIAKLPFKILNKLQLNDLLQIKESYYRLNDYNINLLTGVTELNLISSFDANVNKFEANKTSVYASYKAQTQSVYVTNLGNATLNKVDNGFGVDWLSVGVNANNVFLVFALNETGLSRDLYLDITNEEATKTIRVYVNQSELVLAVLDFSNPNNTVLNSILLTGKN